MRRFPTAALATTVLATALALPIARPAAAEVELSFYTGVQEAFDSHIRGEDSYGEFDYLGSWQGKSFEMPPHWGVRATWWRSERLGYGLEFEHTKAYASDETREEGHFDTLEFTDGLNSLTANVFYRWPGLWAEGKITPYVGGGLGVTVPHVEVTRHGSDDQTFEYQLAGPSAMIALGASWALNQNWSLFGEYKSTFNFLQTDLEGGGNLDTNITTWGINLGVSYSF